MLKRLLFIACFLIFFLTIWSQNKSANADSFDSTPREDKGVRIVFYNAENLFDIYDDSLKRDEDFTPKGKNHWDNYKFYKKENNIAKVIMNIGGWEAPGIIGLCEIENFFVLNHLVKKTALKKFNYRIVHFESPDARGIDNALLYRPEKFKPIYSEAIRIDCPFDKSLRTRDILYVKGLVLNHDTIHLFINHWPSRWGGQAASEPKRMFVAQVQKKIVDSILKVNPEANIIIMGDLNDEPNDKSLTESLKALSPNILKAQALNDTVNTIIETEATSLYNLMIEKKNNGQGSLVYKDAIGYNWNMFDQIIVSGALLGGSEKLIIKNNKAEIFKPDFLLEEKENGIMMPFRTFSGPKYLGGFSDHLPVYIDILLSK
ncbi:MAG: endonuclease [Saprospiraceae bacterium]|nr:endonuclease [Saprospiraceae bacterium]